MYSKTTSEINTKLRATKLEGQKISLEQIPGPDRDQKLASYTAIIEMLGGSVVNEREDAIRLVEGNPGGFNVMPVKSLTDKYFGLI